MTAIHKKAKAHTNKLTPDKIRAQLSDSSRLLADLTASMVYDNPALLKPLIELSCGDSGPLPQRASRVVSICCCRFPELFKPYCSDVIRNLESLRSEGARRNFLLILAEAPVKLTKKDKSLLINLGFDFMTGNFSIAVKVYSMEILYKLSLEMPDIGVELSNLIENSLADSSPGYQSRGMKILKKLQRSNFK
ncbi:MAG: hypothetical protein JW830_13690 [Bacteroidales bacterium]|nr:hypothetical protein [Bacteroidales bacterium]